MTKNTNNRDMLRFNIVSFLFLVIQLPVCFSFLPQQLLVGKNAERFHQDTLKTLSSSPSSSISSLPSSALALQSEANLIAEGLGYLVGAGSFLLYTPIAVRIVRQSSADGLTMSTWWLKLASYTCTDLYSFTKEYPLSTYLDTVVITVEATVILMLVAYYQQSLSMKFYSGTALFGLMVAVALTCAPLELLALGQASSVVLNVGALLPQFALNARLRTAGDYSPITAALASVGCSIRLFTTYQLADSDPLLLGSFGLALLINVSLLAQIIYYGVFIEENNLLSVFTADVIPTGRTRVGKKTEKMNETFGEHQDSNLLR